MICIEIEENERRKKLFYTTHRNGFDSQKQIRNKINIAATFCLILNVQADNICCSEI